MWRLLVHSDTFARIESDLKAFAGQISPLVINHEAELKQPWGTLNTTAAIAYGTQDAYYSPSAPIFFQTLFGFERLDWFQSSAAGTEHPMIQATGRKAELFSGSHAQSDAIAEWVLWAGLDYFQGGTDRRAAQAAKDWKRMAFREISATHWLIVGFGHIGQASAQRLRALGAQVTGVRRSAGTSPHAERLLTSDQLFAALPTADAVLMCLPHTQETESIADAAFFEAMQSGALFVNVGRGALVEEAALLAALDSGHLGHASLDVVRTEPLPAEDRLWTHPKVTLTPHISALTDSAKHRTDKIFLHNLAQFLSRKPLLNAVSAATFAD